VKIRTLMTVSLAGALLLAGCGSDDETGTDEGNGDGSGEGGDGGGEDTTLRVWLNGEDTPQELVDFAIAEFEEAHPGVEVEFERQQWDGIVEKLTTSLSSDDTPDIVELGNTQAQTFEAAGALLDLTDHKGDLGGDDLVQSLVESGTYDDRFYGVPYYGGARIVVYRSDLLDAAGLDVPETMDEFIETGVALKEANAATPNFSGIYLPGRNWHATLSFIWENGGDIAVREGDEWVGQLASPESVEGLEMVQRIMTEANAAPADADDANDYIAFCNDEVGMLMGPGWKVGQIVEECPDMEGKIGAFALPGAEPGSTAPVFLGGSNLAVSAKSRNAELAVEFLQILVGDEYQTKLSELGLLPARTSLLDEVSGEEPVEAQADAAKNSRFVPASEHWAAVEGANILQDMGVAIAEGKDVAEEAARADAAIEETLNQKS
jgi:N,N'-diacetylchitobiose transport system substrate-binding protein